MIKNLLYFGLVFIPFYELIVALFLPAQSTAFLDTRFSKDCIAFMIVLVVGLIGLYTGKMGSIRNKWLLMFVCSLVIAINRNPAVPIELGSFDISNFWIYKPFLQIVVYLLALSSISAMTYSEDFTTRVYKIMAWCGFIMALYLLIQKLGFDQFFNLKIGDEFISVTEPRMVGTMGQSSIIAPYVAICTIPALFLRKYWMTFLMIAVLLLTKSDVAIVSCLIGILFFFTGKKPLIFCSLCAFIALILGGFLAMNTGPDRKHLNDGGRFEVWKTIVDDMRTPYSGKDPRVFSMTGFGIGSFEYLYHAKHHSKFRQAHNEYLEVLWCVGIIGLVLFISSIWHEFISMDSVVLASMFLVICLCAGGTFVWHLAVYKFYTLVILGLSNQAKGYRYEAI
jgi:hypothetical protein